MTEHRNLGVEQPDDYWDAILDYRFREKVSVYHQRPIAKQKPVSPERIKPPDERRRRLVQSGFDFSALSTLYWACGFSEVIQKHGLVLPEELHTFIEYEQDATEVAKVLSVINGDPRIDYESLLAGSSLFQNALKRHMYRMPEDAIRPTAPSPLSVADVLLCATLQRLTSGMDTEVVSQFAEIVGRILDERVKNPERINDYQRLGQMMQSDPLDPPPSWLPSLQHAIRAAHDALIYRSDAPPVSLEHPADVVIPLHGGALSDAAIIARHLVTSGAARYLLPLGGHSPHEVKELGLEALGYCEMEEIMAACCVHEFRHRMPELGSSQLPPVGRPVALSEIIHTDDNASGDTSANAKAAAPFIAELQTKLGRRVNIVMVTCGQHSARARMEFLKLNQALGSDAVSVRVECVPDVAVFRDLERGTKPEALGNLFAEAAKRLFEVCAA